MARLLEHKGLLDAITIRVVGKWETTLSPGAEQVSAEFELKENEECFYTARITNTELFVPIAAILPPEPSTVGVVLEYRGYIARVRIHAHNRTNMAINLTVTVLGMTRA